MNAMIQKGSLLSVVLVFVLAAGMAGQAAAQTAEDALRFTERAPATGPRMMGLAGAGISGVADYSALFNNPAGLGFFQRSSISGSLNAVYATDASFSRSAGFSPIGIDEDVSETNIGNFAYVYRAPTRQGSFVIGLAFNQVNSFERDLRFAGTNSRSTISTSFLPSESEFTLIGNSLDALDDIPFAAFNGGLIEFYPEFLDEDPDAYPFLEAVVPGSTIEQTGSVIERGRMNEVSLGGAVEASKGVMVGLSANLAFGEYDFNSVFEEADVNNENVAEDYSVFLDDGNLLEGFGFLSYRQFVQSELLGINARLGVAAEVAENVRIGLSIETPTYYSVEEDFGARYETFFDDGGSLSYGEFPDDVGNGFFDYEILTPWRFGAGVGFHSDVVTVLADAELVDWSQLELDADTDRAFFDDLNRSIADDYDMVINWRGGIEFRLNDFMLRGGVAYQPDPLDVTLFKSDGSELDRDKLFFSAGMGYRVDNRFQIDFGWMQGRFDTGYFAYPVGPLQGDDLLIDEEVSQNQFVVGVSFFF